MNVSKRYKEKIAVKHVDMFIKEGEIIGLLGPNGAGKSTIIAMLSTLMEPTEGDLFFQGKRILKTPEELRAITGIVPQEIALYEDLTAEENMNFFGKLYCLRGKKLRQEIDRVFHVIGLTDYRKQIVKTFSGGMKRRLNIGVAMLHRPKFLLLDEPTVGIDPQSRNHILKTIKQLNQEEQMTVLYSSHYMEEIEYLCDRLYILDKGQFIASGTKDSIKQLLHTETTVYVEVETIDERFIQRLKEDSAIYQLSRSGKILTVIFAKEAEVFPLLLNHAKQTDTTLKTVKVASPTLEDVFLNLTGRALRDKGRKQG